MHVEKSVCIIGLGYIGLPTAALLANRSYQVHGVDVNPKVVDTINRGEIHIEEPDLDVFVSSAVKSGKLKAALQPVKADVFIIAVPTPFHDGFVPNIDYVLEGTRSIAPFVQPGNLVILESTSPVGTTDMMRSVLANLNIDTSAIHFAHCPERVLPGRIMIELIENDRIVGGLTPESTDKVASFYRNFVQGKVLTTDARTAEMAKLTENSFRDVNIAFANELSLLCDKFGIDVWELIRLANHHPRVKILQPGCGVGGHCIAVDPWFLVHSGKEQARLIKMARLVNDYKSDWVVDRIKLQAAAFEKKHGRTPVVACMGLACKPDIDDLRESPALKIVKLLLADGCKVLPVEPNVTEHPTFSLTQYESAVQQADIVVLLVGHKEFLSIDLGGKIVLDFCGVTKR